MRGVFLDWDTLGPDDLDDQPLQEVLDQWSFHATDSALPVLQRAQHADVIVSNKVILDAELLSRLPQLALICVAATGTNNVDLEYTRRRGIAVCNVRDYATPSVVQHVFALILSLSIHLPEYRRLASSGTWSRSPSFCVLDKPIRELAGLKLGIVGYGVLGRAVAQLAEAFGMQVLVAQRDADDARPGRLPLNELLQLADVVSLHCPLNEQTRKLIDAQALSRMKPDALLINTARGGLVDEQALAEALRDGRLGGAGIDVLEQEPPALPSALLSENIPSLMVTPHIAWASRQSRQRMVHELAVNIRAFIQDKPRNLV